MPIYEYACHGCRKKVSVFQRSVSTVTAARCPECGSEKLDRLISKFSFHRSMPDFDDGPDFDDDAMFGDVDENDPRSVARWARRMGEQMGDDLPPDFEEQIARMEAGEMPDEDGFGDDGFGGFDDED
jgi:putative FmdB family regulatory protein